MKDLHTSIKKFNADELKGKEKLKLKQDKLTELGAPPKKQQKVPFPIQMSRLRWKNKKDIEIKEMIKQSGVVLSIASNNNKSSSSKQNSKAKKVNSKSLNKLQPTLGLNTRKGVFHVSTKRK